MNKKEAYKLLIDGKKVTKQGWVDTQYLYMNGEGNILNRNDCNEYLNDYNNEGWEEYIEDNRKEIPKQIKYLKELWNVLFDEIGSSKVICEDIEKCSDCPCSYKGGCYQGDIRNMLITINKEWKLNKTK